MPDTGLKGDISIPKIGKVKKAYVYGAGALVAAYVGWRWYNARAAGAEDTTYTTDTIDEGLPTGGAGGAASGNVQYGGTTTDATSTEVIDTNAEWTQRAVELLSNAGMDPSAVYAALGEYLAQRPMDEKEQSIARAALAAVGNPPVGGPYAITSQVGETTLSAPGSLRSGGEPSSTVINLTWNAVPGTAYYRIFRTDLGNEPVGASADTKFASRGLTPNKSYTYQVAAISTLGKTGPRSNSYTGKTKTVTLKTPSTPSVSSVSRTSAVASTRPVSGATGYNWYINGVAHGHSDAPKYTVVSLKPNTTYRVSVAADTATQGPGKQSAPRSFKTRK